MTVRRTVLTGALTLLCLSTLPGGRAEAQVVRLTKLSDVAFGTVSTIGSDVIRAQNVCAYASSLSGLYSVRASGSGTGGALTLAGSGAPMAYEVQWSATTGATSGTALPANTTVSGFNDGGVLQLCTLVTTSSASLIVILRSTALSSAVAGSYSGTLTLVLGAQ